MEIDHSDDMRAFGERLAAERYRIGCNEIALGERCGHTASNVKAWEGGRTYPSIPALCALANLGVDVFYLFTGHQGPRSLLAAQMLKHFQGCALDLQQQITSQVKTGAQEKSKDDLDFLTSWSAEKAKP